MSHVEAFEHGTTYPAITLTDLLKFQVPVPPIEVQVLIVDLLDRLDDYAGKVDAALPKEIVASQQRYEWWRDRLLDFRNVRGGVSPNWIEAIRILLPAYLSTGIAQQLGRISQIGTGSSNRNEAVDTGQYPFYVRSAIVQHSNTWQFDEEAILIPGEGGIGDIFHYVNGKYALHQRTYRIHLIDENLETRFLLHYMKEHFKSFIRFKAVVATVQSIRKPMVEDFLVVIPPLPIQRLVVSILDRLDSYTHDLSSGLPAEIEARQKQYEWWRDALLNFRHLDIP